MVWYCTRVCLPFLLQVSRENLSRLEMIMALSLGLLILGLSLVVIAAYLAPRRGTWALMFFIAGAYFILISIWGLQGHQISFSQPKRRP